MGTMQVAALWTDGRTCPIGLDTSAPVFGWSFAAPAGEPLRLTAYRIVVASSEEALRDDAPDMWDSGIVEGGRHTSVRYEGAALRPRRRYVWRVTVWDDRGGASDSEIAWWETGQLSAAEWAGRWIGDPAAGAEGRPMPLFRREFRVQGELRQARVYISGLGHYELRLNGYRVGDYELDAGWTDYDKTVLYTVYDVTDFVQQGDNAAGVLLGNGFYHVTGGRYTKFKDSYGTPRCLVDIALEYADGTVERIGSDRTWTTSAGPLTFSCIYGGEDYDARLEQEGWDRPGFAEDARWVEAAEVEPPAGMLVAQSAPPVKVKRKFDPLRWTQPKPGVFVADLGQNFSGWPSIAVSGPKGSVVKLTPAELLKEDGTANQRWSGAPYELRYTLRGEGVERWRPKFTYYGFSYVQVEGAVPAGALDDGSAGKPTLHELEGQMIYPDTPVAGGFRCSDDMLNRIHEIINWAILSNMKSVFTDCPHREKLGWLEQVHLMGPSMMFNYDIEALLGKVLDDIADAQLPNGMVPTTAPEYVVFQEPWHIFRDSASWGGAFILTAWEMMQRYGNSAMLSRHYEGMKRYLEYLHGQSKGYILQEGLGDWYDIGPKGPGFAQNTPVPLVETAMFYGLAMAMRSIANLLGKAEDAGTFERLGGSIREAFQAEFFDAAASTYGGGSDAAQAMPLVVGLVPEEYRDSVLQRLVDNIEGRGDQTTSGDVGHRYVLLALTQGGRSDLVYRMTRITDRPSYGYQIVHGATTLTEAWDGPTVGNSQNHLMLGHLEEWLYSGLAGLDYRYRPETGRFAVTIKPNVVGDVAWAEAWSDIRAGRASVRWERLGGRRLSVAVEIPGNADAIVHIPAEKADDVRFEGAAIELLHVADGYAVFRTGSGAASFECTLPHAERQPAEKGVRHDQR
ncbi:family 78 glycoside hydrolase catalytic domain [Paenibacillus sp.]|uniref:family 78 glycoside hydrolase catalytic domain n=1 Tax=Paenibacillus sp. TaxID=58172 RepID=UPI002D2BD8C7|nr:family 78 glycoside hydrolase catalytic domain [Paenibacillus sp.]HZG87931.1 family 78 glycoside hydrolase catalytic domain [Paenibacillus sp.]